MLRDPKFRFLLFAVVLVTTLELFALAGFSLPSPYAFPFYFLLILVVGHQTLLHGLKALVTLNMKSISLLMLIAVSGAIYLGQYEEAAIVIVLYTLAEKLEDIGIEKSKSALKDLASQIPNEVQVKNNDHPVPLNTLELGTIIIIKPGEIIPVDSVVIKGSSAVDESSISGEPIPKDKQAGDPLFSGTYNKQGYLEAQVTALPKDSTLAKIQELTFQATKAKAKSHQFIETFAGFYTPFIMTLAFSVTFIPVVYFGADFDKWFLESLTLLVIACPCALVISTPISIYSAVGKASSQGVLVKGGKFLEELAKIKALAFDKTRTLTFGEPIVTDVIPFANNTRESVLACAGGIELLSEHPLSDSIVKAAKEDGIPLHEVKNFESVTGKGLKAECMVCDSGHRCLGKLQFIKEEHSVPEIVIEKIETLQKEGKTAIVISSHKEVIGIIALRDEIRSDSAAVIQDLQNYGIKTVMLTGDQTLSALSVAKEIGIEDVRAELLPQDKALAIEQLIQNYKTVGMVGDGVNDAPALALSSVGITLQGLGSDTAIESASIIILNNQLNMITKMIALGKRMVGIIRFNVFWAILVKVLFIGLALYGMSNLALAIFADVGMTILVIINSLRLIY